MLILGIIIFSFMLAIGSMAPNFSLLDQHGKLVHLNDYKGQKVALFFYPKDNTPTCTVQACNLRDNLALLQNNDIAVLGISVDNEQSHSKFGTKFALNFPILSDVDKSVVNLYEVWGEKKFMGKQYEGTHRTTYLIDKDGRIAHVITKVKSKDHAQQILDTWI